MLCEQEGEEEEDEEEGVGIGGGRMMGAMGLNRGRRRESGWRSEHGRRGWGSEEKEGTEVGDQQSYLGGSGVARGGAGWQRARRRQLKGCKFLVGGG